jgi:spermidine synthase
MSGCLAEFSGPVASQKNGIMSRLLLTLPPFLAGAVIMALELLGFRLFAPHFGASTYVWGGLLGMIMAALAVGYLFGGLLADRHPDLVWVYGLLTAASLYLLGVLLAADAVLGPCEKLGLSWGPVLATLLLLGPPMLLLGSVSPFVVAVQAKTQRVGMTAGRVLALSTAGSLAGTFLTAFWLIPSFGSRATLRLCIGALLITAALGLASRWRRLLILFIAGLFVLFIPDERPARGILYQGESAYNTVIVEEDHGARLLCLNERSLSIHSVALPGRTLTGLYYDSFYLGPVLSGGREVLVLGMAGGTMIQGYLRLFPDAHLTAVEIDPLVAQVARQYFGVKEGPNLEVHVCDARPFLAGTAKQYDVIGADLYAGSPEAPFYVLTREFFDLAQKRLHPNGVLIVNVLALGGDGTLAAPVSATMASVFPSVYEMPLPDNRILFGFRESVSLESLRGRLARANAGNALGSVCQEAVNSLRPIVPAPSCPIFTDDHAPVERITHAMVERYRASSHKPR